MRIVIRHDIELVFEPSVKFLNAGLRLTPRSHDGQHVVRWRVEPESDSRMRTSEDAFGNVVQALSVQGSTSRMRIVADGVVETFDAAGIVRSTVERFPADLFLRDTALTTPDAALRALANSINGANMIERLHTLLLRLPVADAGPDDDRGETREADADEALTHRFIACARLMGAPARFIAGYALLPDDSEGKRHCWAEAYVEGVGWIGFDPVNAICPHEGHVRGAIGLDAQDAGAVRTAPQPLSTTSSVSIRRAD